MSNPAIIFRVDASAAIGGGHLMRCLTLADALSRRGAAVRFLVNPEAPATVPKLADSGFPYAATGGGPWQDRVADDVSAVVVDHYGLSAGDEMVLSRRGVPVVVLDDLADRPHVCDLLVDQTAGRAPAAYRSLVPPTATVLAGSDFALIAPPFVAARPAALDRRRRRSAPRRLLVSMGLTDVGGITGHMVAAASRLPALDRIDVPCAPSQPSWPAVVRMAEGDRRIHVMPLTGDMAGLMRDADVAIGSAGTTSWERCCLGLPSVVIQLADNQTDVIATLVRRGAAVRATDAGDAATTLESLLDAPARLLAMAEAASAMIDGCGTARIAAAILSLLKPR